jgi:hypothetical protein
MTNIDFAKSRIRTKKVCGDIVMQNYGDNWDQKLHTVTIALIVFLLPITLLDSLNVSEKQ